MKPSKPSAAGDQGRTRHTVIVSGLGWGGAPGDRRTAHIVVPEHCSEALADESDNRLVEDAEAASAEFIVTGDDDGSITVHSSASGASRR